jgi:hypothetical protein
MDYGLVVQASRDTKRSLVYIWIAVPTFPEETTFPTERGNLSVQRLKGGRIRTEKNVRTNNSLILE